MIDHLIWGVADLDAGVAELSERLGVRPALGGRHLGRGTANALLSLGHGTYLELLGPDPGRPPGTPVAMGLDLLERPRLVSWAVSSSDLEAGARAMREVGWDPGPITAMERRGPEGRTLRWRLTLAPEEAVPSVVPFLIDWGKSEHPSTSSPSGLRLSRLRLQHPRPETILPVLAALGCEVEVIRAAEPALLAELETEHGPELLR